MVLLYDCSVQAGYQIIVIGGGHAGAEAAWAAANVLRAPRSVALITMDPGKIGEMSCNPAIGGLAKGQLVREVDALGGLMGLATDATGIQFRMLNTSKGPAVHGPRAQCDKHAYARAVQLLIASRPEIDVIAASVDDFVVENSHVRGVVLSPSPVAMNPTPQKTTSTPAALVLDGLTDWPARASWPREATTLRAQAVVLTTGTFMRALMHTGEAQTPGGRHGEAPANAISGALRALGFELGRLKTGTPPRLARDSIRIDTLAEQPGDAQPLAFSDLALEHAQQTSLAPQATSAATTLDWWRASADPHANAAALQRTHEALASWASRGFLGAAFPLIPQVVCLQTSTTHAAHELIRANLHRAPMYSGQIESSGPRYCPSIEDKVVRFAERTEHGVYLEPESIASDWVYCNGISTSLPRDVQDAIVRAMPGCEHAIIHRYGYAVEYDMVPPHQILATGRTKRIEGLYLAGQINGTSGYEEAAAQGLIAGANAALAVLGQSELVLGREEAYIGVLMDDLVTKTPREPYRMFTSRAEHRLLLRADNAWDRLTPIAQRVGLLAGELGEQRTALHARRTAQRAALHALIDRTRIDGQPLEKLMRGQAFEMPDFERAIAAACECEATLSRAGPTPQRFDAAVLRTVLAERRYEAYITRQHAEVRRQADMEHRAFPAAFDFAGAPHLRTEAREALARFSPRTLGQASRLEGITPADIALLSVLVRRHRAAKD